MTDDIAFDPSHGFAIDQDQACASQRLETDARTPNIDAPVHGQAALPQAVTAFAAGLEPDLAERCRASARIILDNEKRTSAGRIDSGKALMALKGDLKHGQFKSYVGSLGLKIRTAEHCMRVAEVFGEHRDTVAVLSFDLLKKLSAEAVPQAVRDMVVAQLEAGEELTPKAIGTLIRKARGEKRKLPPDDTRDTSQRVPEPSPEPDTSAVLPGNVRAVASQAQRDDEVVRLASEFVSAKPGEAVCDGAMTQDGQTQISPPGARAIDLIVGTLTQDKARELDRCLAGVLDAREFIVRLRQRCGIEQRGGLDIGEGSDADGA